MRADILAYIKGLTLGTFSVANELPWTESGLPLYQRNQKKIYVDLTEETTDPLIATLNGFTLNTKTTSISVYFSTDAKQLPSNYDQVVTGIKGSKDIAAIEDVNSRQCDVETNYENDLLITQFTFRFTKLT
jgi:hypothetical protein